MRFNSCNLGDKAILRGLGNREDEAGAEAAFISSLFQSLQTSPTLPAHTSLTRRKKKSKKKRKEKRPAADADRVKHLTAKVTVNWPDMMVSVMLRLFRDRPRDWREEDEDVLEVSEGGRAVLMGVAVGVALPLDLSWSFSALSVSISFCWSTRDLKKKKKKKEFERKSKSASAAGSDSTAWAGLCCYSESVLLELKAISAFFDLQGPLCSEGWGSDKEPYTWSPDLRWDYRLPQTRQPNVCGNPLNRRRLRGRSLTARCFVEREKKKRWTIHFELRRAARCSRAPVRDM